MSVNARAVRIFKTYGSDAIQVMTENPYRLAPDIRGIGFKTADAIAMKLGIEKTAMMRGEPEFPTRSPRLWTRGTADCQPTSWYRSPRSYSRYPKNEARSWSC
jgi:hypothetical protein